MLSVGDRLQGLWFRSFFGPVSLGCGRNVTSVSCFLHQVAGQDQGYGQVERVSRRLGATPANGNLEGSTRALVAKRPGWVLGTGAESITGPDQSDRHNRVCEGRFAKEDKMDKRMMWGAVSYTHLTLPTNREV